MAHDETYTHAERAWLNFLRLGTLVLAVGCAIAVLIVMPILILLGVDVGIHSH